MWCSVLYCRAQQLVCCLFGVFSMDEPRSIITEEALRIKGYINLKWPQFRVEVEQQLRNILPKPTNYGLAHIWKYGAADLVVYLGNKLICIFEPGGSQHFTDEKQIKNDKRKWMLCHKNGVRCL